MSIYDRILLIGSKGMLAGAVRREIESRGHTATGVDQPELDITQPEQVSTLFRRLRPTLVLNCAAYTNVDGCETNTPLAMAVNGTGVGHLARSALEVGAKLVHISTDYVFDGTLRRPLRPADPVGPVSAYGKSKLLGEQEIQKGGLADWLIIRTAWLYGPGGPNFPQAMLNAARAGKPLRVVADQFGSPTFTFDLATAMFKLLDRGSNGIWHIANSGETNWFDFAAETFNVFGVKPAVFERISSEQWKQIKPDSAIRPSYSVFDLTPYQQAVGEPMPHWQDALRRYAKLAG